MCKKQMVEEYIEGFRSGNPTKVLDCLDEGIIWRLHGCQTFIGKAAFAENIENEDFREMPILRIRELIQEGDRVVATGFGAVEDDSGKQRTFEFCEIFLFQGELVREIDTFHVWNQ